MAVLQLADGRLLIVAPQEVEFDPSEYPSLGIGIWVCVNFCVDGTLNRSIF